MTCCNPSSFISDRRVDSQAIESADGDLELLQCCIDGANVEVDESAEERKGGAGGLGKMFLSAGDKQLAIYCHVPKALAEEKGVSMKEWVDAVIAPIKDRSQIVETGEEITKIVVPGNPGEGAFPLKMRDEAIAAGFAFLRQKGLVPEDDSSDDDINYADAAGVEW